MRRAERLPGQFIADGNISVGDPLHLATVDAEFQCDRALAAARAMALSYRLLQRQHRWWFIEHQYWRILARRRVDRGVSVGLVVLADAA